MLDFSHVDVQPDAEAVAARVADWLIDVARGKNICRVCLSGGSTPKALFALLAQSGRARQVEWSRMHLFWGDERVVPYSSPDSNYGEAKRLLLDHVQIPPANVHPMPTDGDPDDAAARYEAILQAEYGASTLDPQRPLFDVNFLGLGEDGHTASLIPGQPVLSVRDRWVAAVGQGRPEVRLTLTYPALQSATTVAFIAVGGTKTDIVARLRRGAADVPAARLVSDHGMMWFLDRSADGS